MSVQWLASKGLDKGAPRWVAKSVSADPRELDCCRTTHRVPPKAKNRPAEVGSDVVCSGCSNDARSGSVGKRLAGVGRCAVRVDWLPA